MTRKLLLTLVTAMAIVGNAVGQEVTLDFTSNTWELPEGSSNGVTSGTYSNGTYSISLSATTAAYYNTSGYLMLGKNGSTLTLPAFDFDVSKIVVTSRSGASTSMKMNVLVGATEVSTAITGLNADPSTFEIDANYQAAGNVYILKVQTAYNAQITKIEIYKVGEESGTEEEETTTANTIDLTSGNTVTFTDFSNDVLNTSYSPTSTATTISFTADNNTIYTGFTAYYALRNANGCLQLQNSNKGYVILPTVTSTNGFTITVTYSVLSDSEPLITYGTYTVNGASAGSSGTGTGGTAELEITATSAEGVQIQNNSSNALYISEIKLTPIGYGSITLNAEYGTFYCEKAIKAPSSPQFGIITAADSEGTLTIGYYNEGDEIPAQTGLLAHGEAGTYSFQYYNNSTATAPESNLLHGADALDESGNTYVEGTDVKYYYLTKGEDDVMGFYWRAENGGAFSFSAYPNNAFLAVEGGLSVRGFSLGDATTGITSVETAASNNNAAIYNLAGQRVSKPTKGVYIQNGRKFIVK